MYIRLMAVVVLVLALLSGGCGPRVAEAPSAPLPPAGAGGTPTGATGPGLTGQLTVAVPCGLAMVYKEVRTLFQERNPGVKFKETVENIGPMTKAVRDGKLHPDLFISLGDKEIAELLDAGKVEGKPTPFLRQDMQLCVQLGNPLGIKSLEDLAKPEVKTVAVCDPMLTIGEAGQKTLEAAGVWEKLEKQGKVVRPGQPMEAKQLVIDKRADATFIYSACANENWKEGDPERTVIGKADVVLTVPQELYGGMFGVVALLKDAPNAELAKQFIAFLLSPEAQEAVTKWGYGKVEAEAG
ncbi:MAG: molybdate ABC transporter substrate-binding protein [Armatimonadetes bacterium]|nr:molybdate ABC transporter substrate-binding protein [Armatimonadota bacterium]